MANGFVPKVGQCYYRMYRGKFGIWRKADPETSIGDEFVCDCYTKQDAARVVKELNNWK